MTAKAPCSTLIWLKIAPAEICSCQLERVAGQAPAVCQTSGCAAALEASKKTYQLNSTDP